MVFTRFQKNYIQQNNKRLKINYIEPEMASFIVPDSDTDSESCISEPENETDITTDITTDMQTDVKIEVLSEEESENGCDNYYKPQSKNELLFNQHVESIYIGDFFENDLDNIDKKLSNDELTLLNKELHILKQKYLKTPTVIDILKKDLPILEKQVLLEELFHLANCDLLSPEYNKHLSFIKHGLDNVIDPELKNIENEILKSSIDNDLSYKIRILKSKMSFQNKVICYNKMKTMETINDQVEYSKHKMWLDSLLSVPFGITNNINTDINNVRMTLDSRLSFLEKPKDQIINIITQGIRNDNAGINAIGLYGGVGMGKTSICESIAKALNRPFKMISLGGESDSNSLTGHGFTYIGSGSGSIINSLIETKSMNPVLLLDEIDKISETHQGKEIIGTLIHLIDSTTNHRYNHDKYFSGIEFDMSNILFIFTYNDPTKIDKILADRLFKIHVDNYTFNEKLCITNTHLIKNVLQKFNFTNNDFIFTKEAITYLIQNNKSNGMRDIKTRLHIIVSRANTLLLTNESENIVRLKYKKLYPFYKSLPITVLREHIDTFLDESITTDSDNSLPPFMYI
jgi:ATP-dependent Lon protease